MDELDAFLMKKSSNAIFFPFLKNAEKSGLSLNVLLLLLSNLLFKNIHTLCLAEIQKD